MSIQKASVRNKVQSKSRAIGAQQLSNEPRIPEKQNQDHLQTMPKSRYRVLASIQEQKQIHRVSMPHVRHVLAILRNRPQIQQKPMMSATARFDSRLHKTRQCHPEIKQSGTSSHSIQKPSSTYEPSCATDTPRPSTTRCRV